MGCAMFAYSWGCNFLDVVVFRFNRKTKSFIISFLIPTQILMISHVHAVTVSISLLGDWPQIVKG